MNYRWRGDKITQIKVGLNGTVDMDKYSGRCKHCLIQSFEGILSKIAQ